MTRYDLTGPVRSITETTEYIQGDRRREEYGGPSQQSSQPDGPLETQYSARFAAITRCDLGTRFQLDLDQRVYDAVVLPRFAGGRQSSRATADSSAAPGNARTILIETHGVDTGERREIFGRLARHVTTIVTRTTLGPGGTNGVVESREEDTIDGWYIDLDTGTTCEPRAPHRAILVSFVRITGPDEPEPRLEFRDTGTPETGYAVAKTTTMRSEALLPDGTMDESVSNLVVRVTTLEDGPLDPALFEVPPAFRERPVPLSARLWAAWEWLKETTSRLFD